MKKILSQILIIFILITSGLYAQNANKVKYIFFFIGDGMGINQVYITEKYNTLNRRQTIIFINDEWSFGMVSTDCADSNRITDSGAGGTALACGQRTSFESIGEYNGKELESIAEYLHKNKKFKIGIITNVPINHATPAAFYGHEPHRKNYTNLIEDLIASRFEFFAGGGFLFGNKNDKEKNNPNYFNNILDKLKKNDFELFLNSTQLEDFKSREINRVICIDTVIRNNRHQFLSNDEEELNSLPFALDEPYKSNKLAFYSSLATEFLMNEKGFFIMVESGKIDWACHKNDALTVIHEINLLNEAVSVAYNFYLKYPENTLIIVTADHETGGMAMGTDNDNNQSLNSYAFYPEKLSKQKQSYLFIDRLTLQNIQNEAQIGWTTQEHTAAPVGIWVIGKGKENFYGFMKNSDLKNKILKLIE